MGAVANAATLARKQEFRDQVLAVVCALARNVMAEPSTTPNFIFRVAYARSVLMAPLTYQESFAWTMACDPEIAKLSILEPVPESLLITRTKLAFDALIAPTPTSA